MWGGDFSREVIVSHRERLEPLLREIWDAFHPAIPWWANKSAATDPKNAACVCRERLSGPKGAGNDAIRLKPLLPAATE